MPWKNVKKVTTIKKNVKRKVASSKIISPFEKVIKVEGEDKDEKTDNDIMIVVTTKKCKEVGV